jgi:predicted component of type VI protein secretion system
MAPQTYQLVMRTGPTPGKSYELREDEITIGRDISNDIVISDVEISRQHSRLIAQGGGYVLEDRGSTNGTFVNGQRLMGPHLMRPGEVILLGENVSLVYQQLDFDTDATMVSGTGVPSMPPVATPAAGYYEQPQNQESRRAAPPTYQEPVPATPAEPYYSYPPEEEEESPSRSRTWIYVGCGCLLVLACVLVAGAFAFDTLDLYCTPPFDALFSCP